MSINPSKFWIKEIDYLRGLAIISVIAFHSVVFTPFINLNALVFTNAFIFVLSFVCIPLFILISGFVLTHKYYKNFSKKIFYKKRVKSIIPQYLIFSIFYLIFFAAIDGFFPTFTRVLFKIFIADSGWHLWFMALIIQFYLFYPLILKIYRYFENKNKLKRFFVTAFIFQILFNTLVSLLTHQLDNDIIEPILHRIFLSYLFYFILGMYLSRNFSKVKKFLNSIISSKLMGPIIFLALIISSSKIIGYFSFGNFSYLPEPFSLIQKIMEMTLYILLFGLSFKITTYLLKRKGGLSSIIFNLGKLSFGIYFIHLFFLEILHQLLPKINIQTDNFIFYPIIFLGTITFSYIAINLIKNLPHSKIIIGRH